MQIGGFVASDGKGEFFQIGPQGFAPIFRKAFQPGREADVSRIYCVCILKTSSFILITTIALTGTCMP